MGREDSLIISDVPPQQQNLDQPQRQDAELEHESTFFLPRIDQFPEKIRPVIHANHERALKKLTDAQQLVDLLVASIDLFSQFDVDQQDKTENISSEEQKLIDSSLQQVTSEFSLLLQSYDKLQQSRDPYDLLVQRPYYLNSNASPFLSHDVHILRETYKKNQTLSVLVKDFFRGRPERSYTRDSYFSTIQLELSIRALSSARSAVKLDERVVNIPQYPEHTNMVSNLESLVLTPEDFLSYLRDSMHELQNYIRDSQHASTLKACYAEKLRLWMDNFKDRLQLLSTHEWQGENNAYDLLGKLLEQTTVPTSTEVFSLANAKDSIIGIKHRAIVAILNQLNKTLRECYSSYSLGVIAPIREITEAPLEAVQVLKESQLLIQIAEKSLHESGNDSNLSARLVDDCMMKTKFFQERLEKTTLINQELPKSQDLFWHVAKLPIMKKILKTGVLASRAYQHQHFGEVSFASGGIISNTKDSVTFWETREHFGEYTAARKITTLTHPEYEEYRKTFNKRGKDLLQEYHQVCLALNHAYMYKDGIALVYSKADLFSSSQFMDADGYHFFDPTFDSGNFDSPGFHKDFLTSNFVIVVAEEKKDEFINYLNELAAQNDSWLHKVGHLPDWMNSHVLFSNDLDTADSEREIKLKVNELLRQQGMKPVKPGYFMPTGENGEAASRTHEPLYTYKPVE